MSRIAYVNGQYVPFASALVHVEDRGYQLADGVYEVIAVWEGLPVDLGPHLRRLGRSLAELRLESPVVERALCVILRSLVERNYIRQGILYVQVSRGVARREHTFPPPVVRSTLVVTAHSRALMSESLFEKGVSVITMHDLRWQRCDIKSITLLPNVLSRQAAHERGAFEAWLLASDGTITEGTASTAWIVTNRGQVITRPLSHALLDGVTRGRVLALASRLGLEVVERPFTLEEAKQAAEAFLTSTTTFVLPIVALDGRQIKDGRPGAVTHRLRTAYLSAVTSGAASW
ncbi:D-alanine aminotransferase [invertebrate metagenome]|uniref:D-alanine aminotransferase n=1 Tax=invertebrate metagenome TaxID=1711999 RepID=A0A484HA26_9ZZZZ